jgi:hypothetical protein
MVKRQDLRKIIQEETETSLKKRQNHQRESVQEDDPARKSKLPNLKRTLEISEEAYSTQEEKKKRMARFGITEEERPAA